MLTLSLFRHAKSSWDDEQLSDFDRPLAPRGIKAARQMGRYMRDIALAPDRILCSTALRTRQTAAIALDELGNADFPVHFDQTLYLAEPLALLARIGSIAADVRHLLLIGHNPGLQELALLLMNPEHAPERDEIAEKLPTAALVVLEMDTDGWQQLSPGAGRLVHYMTPRKLARA